MIKFINSFRIIDHGKEALVVDDEVRGPFMWWAALQSKEIHKEKNKLQKNKIDTKDFNVVQFMIYVHR